MESKVFNEDCMIGMARFPDGYFELAIVDPPYGIDVCKSGKVGGEKCAKVSEYTKSDWDSEIPNKKYFDELMRVSKNQIIWGGNYMIENLYNTPCFLVWDKDNTGNFADCELAWTSFDTAVRMFTFRWNGMLQQNMKEKETRIHPTQKPKQLYRWILQNYAKPGDKILDTHVGSGSSRIACMQDGFDFIGFEIDKDYFEAQEKRFANYKAQLRLW